jgi:hypothetical protein
MSGIQSVTLLAGGLMLAASMARCEEERPPSVPGELIVKFRDSSPGGEAMAGASSPADEAVERYLAAASREIGIPLAAESLTSGGELLLEIDQGELIARLLAKLGTDERVAAAEEIPVARETLEVPPRRVRVRFASGRMKSAEIETFARELGRELGFGLVSRKAGRSETVLSVDLAALTEELLSRLEEHPDVEYVQRNAVLGTFGG